MSFSKPFYDLHVDYLCFPENFKTTFIEDFPMSGRATSLSLSLFSSNSTTLTRSLCGGEIELSALPGREMLSSLNYE